MYHQEYQKVFTELISKGVYKAEELFDYNSSKIAILFDRFFYFCHINLENHCQQYDIQPARFIFYNNLDVNAAALSNMGYNLIEVNSGLILKMYSYFYDNNKAFQKDEYLKVNYSPLFPLDAPPDFIMYQVTPQFTYYHELAHLIQFAPLIKKTFKENYRSMDGSFDIMDHLLEFDADLHAAQLLYFHIEQYWKKLSESKRTADSLSKYIALYAASIFVYFTLLEDRAMPLYFEAESHPHPLIRITYILDIIVGVAQENFKETQLDAKLILREAFNIVSLTNQANAEPNSVEMYAARYQTSNHEITDYVNKLIAESDKHPFLVKNRPEK